MINDAKITREEVWLRAWCSVASSGNCCTEDIATEWADKCLQEFEERFGDENTSL